MTRIDISVYNNNHRSDGPHNEALRRQSFTPKTGKIFWIKGGPSALRISQAPLNEVGSDIAEMLCLYDNWNWHDEVSRQVIRHIPLEFTVCSVDGDEESLGVYVGAIDYEANRDCYHKDLWRDDVNADFGEETMLIRGWYFHVPKPAQRRASVTSRELHPCLITYNPKGNRNRAKGYIASIVESEPPQTQLIKDLRVLDSILGDHFQKGFMESFAPDGQTRWGYDPRRITEDDGWLELGALWDEKKNWRYYHRLDCTPRIQMVGVSPYRNDSSGVFPSEIRGDLIYCSDGTILHSYYFSQEVAHQELGYFKRKIPDTWKDGYYFNRFYPKNSPLVPKSVVDSFNKEMPDHFKQKLLEEVRV